MATQIWRFPVPIGERNFFLAIPDGAKFLKLLMKGDQPQLYFRVPDGAAPCHEVMFFVVPTGVPFLADEEQAVYLDSFVVIQDLLNGRPDPMTTLVFHLLVERASA